MRFRISEALPLLAIGTGLIISQSAGLDGPTTAFFSLFGVLASGYYAGPRLVRDTSSVSITWGCFASLALLMIFRGVWFYLPGAQLGEWGDVWTTLMMLAVAIGLNTVIEPKERNPETEKRWRPTLTPIVATLVSTSGLLLIALIASRHATMNSIRTPWPLMSWWTLPLIGLLWALALSCAWRFRKTHITFIQIVCALGALTVIAPLVYAIGYGFDGFLHVAGETILAKTGTLTPKPPYYVGQYVFVTWLSQIFGFAIAAVDRWLVPVAAAILIPAAATLSAKRWTTILPALVLVPLGAFVATTPHGFATVLGVTALLLTVGTTGRREGQGFNPVILSSCRPVVPFLFASWATLTHPLVGLPILCAVVAALFWAGPTWMRWTLGWLAAIGAGISVPLVFGLASNLGSATGVNFDLSKLIDPTTWSAIVTGFIPLVPNRYALWAQTAEWIVKLLPWLVVLFAGLGLFHKDERTKAPFIIAAISTFFAALVLRIAGDFGFLIDYERGNYADRLFMVALLLLLPVAIPELGRRLERAANTPLINKIAILIAIGFLGAGASYAALPRHDAVNTSRGWTVGSADIEAVKLIDQDANGAAYTVLANQSVSAAAVKTFGFKRYNDDIFFYPIPTGGPLYDLFLRASYESPSRDTMKDAARLGGSSLVYFVVNDYWWDAGRLAERATSSTDREFVIQDGKVKVFKYELK